MRFIKTVTGMVITRMELTGQKPPQVRRSRRE